MDVQEQAVAVYGATGHTGKFVIAELLRREIPVVAVGRNPSRLPADIPSQHASIENPEQLAAAFAGCAVVINCAGPFLDTAAPVARAAIEAGASYLDVTAEQASAQATFSDLDAPAAAAGVAVIPAAGFYGGLADLMATALVGSETVEHVETAVALDRWWPTEGTRRTGDRNHYPRLALSNGELLPIHIPAETRNWAFSTRTPIQPVVELPFSEIITISRHLRARNVRSYISANALQDVRSEATPAPVAVDVHGRSAQQFIMDVVARNQGNTRRMTASGQDIYAISAPLVVEAAMRIMDGQCRRAGTLTLGEAFDASQFLQSLATHHLRLATYDA